MGVDLVDFYRGKITPRRLAILSDHLPPQGAVMRAYSPEAARWGETEHIIAHHIDVAAALAGSEYRVVRPAEAAEKREREAEHRARMQAKYMERQRAQLQLANDGEVP